jgi:hypothetical protein
MSKRSYYSTPLFISVTIIGLIFFVEYFNYQQDIVTIAQDNYISSLNTSADFSKNLRNLQDKKALGHIKTPESVRAIYMSSWVAGTPSLRNKLIAFIDESDINSVVIDIKDSTGVVSFIIDDPVVKKYQTENIRIRDIENLIKILHEKNIYIIGRLTAFQDPLLAKKEPSWAFTRVDNGQTWKDRKGLAFINPQSQQSWDYLARIAKYSYSIGFDEINFDYIRYPSDGNITNIDYNLKEGETKRSSLKSFYHYLDTELRSQNIPISADIFGLVTTAKQDVGIGQHFEDIYPYFDAIVPMVYPSHYRSGHFGYDNPNAHPYSVVTQSMQSAYDRAVAMKQDPQKLRTWIQDFSLGSPKYGKSEIIDQIQATYDVGLDSYMSWDPKNRYTKDAYYAQNYE